MNINIVIVDDHQLIRDLLRIILLKQPDLHVVGEAANGESALSLAGSLHPDLIIMDIKLANGNGMEVSRQILARYPHIKILILTGYPDPDKVCQAVDVGVNGFLLKANAAEDLIRAIRIIRNGEAYFCPDVLGALTACGKPPHEVKQILPAWPVSEPVAPL